MMQSSLCKKQDLSQSFVSKEIVATFNDLMRESCTRQPGLVVYLFAAVGISVSLFPKHLTQLGCHYALYAFYAWWLRSRLGLVVDFPSYYVAKMNSPLPLPRPWPRAVTVTVTVTVTVGTYAGKSLCFRSFAVSTNSH
jgi:hypothetical protein